MHLSDVGEAPQGRTLEVSFQDGVLRVTITGTRASAGADGVEEAVQSWRAISNLRKRYKTRHVLVIDNLTGPPSSIRSHAVGASVERTAKSSGVKCAVVIADEEIRRNVVLGTRMATERGANSEVFADVEAAERWLRSD
jgi:hypothetical protein